MLTKNDLLKIEQYFKKATKKDTDFTSIDKEHIDANTKLPVIHDNENKIINLQDFFSSEVSRNLIIEVLAILEEKKSELDSFIAYTKRILDDISEAIGVTQEFGQSMSLGISQKTLTDNINKLWKKISDITGESLFGINMTVTPNYFISEDEVTVNIKASSTDAIGIFEKISFYKNSVFEDNLIATAEQVFEFEHETTLSETTDIICVAKILGDTYTATKTITHYNSFWVGAGLSYEDIMTPENIRPLDNGMRMNFDVTFDEESNLIIVMGLSLANEFTRADMNGIEIPLTKEIVTIDDKSYTVFTSDEVFEVGEYNIDINS